MWKTSEVIYFLVGLLLLMASIPCLFFALLGNEIGWYTAFVFADGMTVAILLTILKEKL